MSNPLSKIWLIATREYLAYVKTVGFWLSLLTVPLIIVITSVVPALLIKADTPEKVAVIDLSGAQIAPQLESIITKAGASPEIPANLAQAAKSNPALRMITDKMADKRFDVVPWAAPVAADAPLESVENAVKTALRDPNGTTTTVLVAFRQDDAIAYHIWSKPDVESRLEDHIRSDIYEMSFFRTAQALGLSEAQAKTLNETKAVIETHDIVYAPKAAQAEKPKPRKGKGPAVLGALVGYLTWIAVFSSSMLLLQSVIEEKSNRVLEVLLASISTESLLTGKVLGVAMVLITVVGIWSIVAGSGISYGMTLLPADIAATIAHDVGALFTPKSLLLMIVYLTGGYLMYGMFFTVVGAFCETPKDAQAILGPMMIVLMIPMIALQSAFVSPDLPMIKYLSYVPVFSPFLMPVRVGTAQAWEILLTLVMMAAVTFFMMRLGRRAFKQGALSTGKVTFKTFFAALGARG
jgi:ABC-2 type transport system permease protein